MGLPFVDTALTVTLLAFVSFFSIVRGTSAREFVDSFGTL
jgi:hypothetical protein